MIIMIYDNIVRFISVVVGCFYPAFASYRFLNDQQRLTDNDLCIWLTYWVVYGVYSVFDYLTTGLGACIPLLSEMKLVFLCWLLPTIGAGSKVIYEDFLKAFFSNNERTIEQALVHVSLAIVDFLDQLLRTCLSHIMAVADDYLLTRGVRPALRITPSMIEAVAKIRMDMKRKPKTEDLANAIEKVLGDDTNENDDTFVPKNKEVLSESGSDELVFKELISGRKQKPKILPKPLKIQSSFVKHAMDPKPELNQNQNVVSADEDIAEKAKIVEIAKKAEIAEKAKVAEIAEKTENAEIAEKTEKAEIAEKTEKTEKAEIAEIAEIAEVAEIAEKAEVAEIAEKAEIAAK